MKGRKHALVLRGVPSAYAQAMLNRAQRRERIPTPTDLRRSAEQRRQDDVARLLDQGKHAEALAAALE